METVIWTFQEYMERIAQMEAMGLSEEQIMLIMRNVTIQSSN